MKKFTILIEDDWEVSGNGLGNVSSLQYYPAVQFMDIADSLGIKVTFMVEVAQQLVYEKYQELDRNVKIQKNLWDQTVLLMVERGHDVQLHLHPQWIGAEYRKGFFFVNKQWNIGTYNNEEQSKLIKNSCEYLEKLVRTIQPNYKIKAFKGGSWGLQPSETLLQNLSSNGIEIVMGVIKGIEIPDIGVDYTGVEEDTLPYHPNFKDITKVSKTKNGIKVLPIPSYSPSLIELLPYFVGKFKKKIIGKLMPSDDIVGLPNEIKNNKTLKSRKKFNLSTRPFKTHLNIGDESFSIMKNAFDATIKRLRKVDEPNIPIVIESHTKVFANNYNDVAKFLTYILEKYGDEVEFSTMSAYLKRVKANEVN